MDNLKQHQVKVLHDYQKARNLIQEPYKKPIVAFAGINGSYTEDAAIKFFGKETLRLAIPKFEDIFKSILSGNADYGVIPIENSTTGSVRQILDLMLQYNCFIVGETQVKIDHNLLSIGKELNQITDIFAHEQSLMQCEQFFQQNPEIRKHVYVNNALACEYVKKENNPHFAAIASQRASQLFDLNIIESHIHSHDINTTRFIIIADHPEERDLNNKISLSFSVSHEPGALVSVLNIFDKYKLNLSKIESRPSLKKNWEYIFFVDIEGELDNDNVDLAVKEIVPKTIDFKFLGAYRANLNE